MRFCSHLCGEAQRVDPVWMGSLMRVIVFYCDEQFGMDTEVIHLVDSVLEKYFVLILFSIQAVSDPILKIINLVMKLNKIHNMIYTLFLHHSHHRII